MKLFDLTDPYPSPDKRLFPFMSNGTAPVEYLIRLSKDDLMIMRNEIFASHGYIFRNPKLKAYFESQTWYKPESNNVDDKLRRWEKYNLEIIKSIESLKQGDI